MGGNDSGEQFAASVCVRRAVRERHEGFVPMAGDGPRRVWENASCQGAP